jgi:phage gp29-like protein
MPVLYGPDGSVIPVRDLMEEQAHPSVTGVRQVFDEHMTSGLTPQRLSRILRDADQGEIYDFMTLAEEMEERENQYRYALETRKNGVTELNIQISPASEDKNDIKIGDFLRDNLLVLPAFQTLADHMVDALAKGFAAIEIIWALNEKSWLPVDFIRRDQRLFQFDRETRTELRLSTHGDWQGEILRPFKWIRHIPLLKSGIPARNGLARPATFAYMLKAFSLKDWSQFLEIYGQPLRLGKYGPGSSREDRAVLLSAVRNLGPDAAAIIPQGMEIEFIEAKGFSDKPYESYARYIDEQLTKLIIGKPNDGSGGSRAAEEIHDKVRIDIKKADARDVAMTLQRDLILPIVNANFGPQQRYPTVMLPVPERRDLQVWSNALTQLIDRGLEVEQSQVYDVIGLKEPEPGAKLMQAGTSQTPPLPKPEKASLRSCPVCTPVASTSAEIIYDERDRLVDEALSDWQPDMEPMRAALQEALSASTSFDDFEARLLALGEELPVDQLARRLTILSMTGRARGEAGEP